MNTTVKLALATLSGVLIGAFGVGVTGAQTKPPAFLVAEFEVTDPVGWKTYVDGAPRHSWRRRVVGSRCQGNIARR
jgi:hypothetical protein